MRREAHTSLITTIWPGDLVTGRPELLVAGNPAPCPRYRGKMAERGPFRAAFQRITRSRLGPLRMRSAGERWDPMPTTNLNERDWQIRGYVYTYFVEHEQPPAYEQAAKQFGLA